MAPRAIQCLAYTLLVVPPLLLTLYLLAAFPTPPSPLHIHPSLASLPKTCKSWEIYPDDYYSGGAYVELPYGKVRYWLMGPETGTKIVLIHGLSVPSLIWKDIAPQMADQGYRVLLYDLYGRGYSDAPDTTYDARLYSTQLALLVQHVGWEKAVVAGVSMGGAIAGAFTANFPQLVEDKVILIASTGIIETSDLPRTLKFMSSPIVQRVTSSAPVRKFIKSLTDTSAPSYESDHLQQIVRIQSAHLPGFNAAVGSSLRQGPIRGLHAAFASPSFASRRVLIIHGTRDTVVSFKYAPQIAGLLPEGARREIVIVEDGGHDLTISHPERVWGEMRRFLEE